MKLLLTLIAILLQTIVHSQTKGPTEVTPEIETRIRTHVDKSAVKFKQLLAKQNITAEQIEFAIDTFKVNHYMSEYLKYDYSTVGMKTAVYEAAEAYDGLLNKYYQQLLKKLKIEDRVSLVEAQKVWIAYRDAELDLKNTLGKEDYSGGGTIVLLTQAAFYLDIIKKRVVELNEHYQSIGRGIY